MDNLIQFAPIFAAAGCTLNFDSATNQLEVVEDNGKLDAVVANAVAEIACYLDTANYQDGLSALAICDMIDMQPNPLSNETRKAVLTGLGIMREDRYVSQALALQKTNRSWHTSDKAGECTFFGKTCTHRGVVNVPGKRGRKATREPNEYHRISTSGVIAREQLVTPALEKLWESIPSDRLISIEKPRTISMERLLRSIPPERLAEIIELREKELALLKEHDATEHA